MLSSSAIERAEAALHEAERLLETQKRVGSVKPDTYIALAHAYATLATAIQGEGRRPNHRSATADKTTPVSRRMIARCDECDVGVSGTKANPPFITHETWCSKYS